MTRDELEALLRTHSLAALGRMWGVSDSTVGRWARAMGIVNPRADRRGALNREEFEPLWASELPVFEIAERLGVTTAALYAAGKRWGLPRKDRRRKLPPDKEVARLRQKHSAQEIADKYGVMTRAVVVALGRHHEATS